MLQIGFSEISITPEKKVYLAGQFFERISEYVETEVTATAMAVEKDGEQLVICSCDLVNISGNLLEEVRVRVAAETSGLDPSKITVSATHTHTSLLYAQKSFSGGSSLQVLRDYLPENKTYLPKISGDVMSAEECLHFLVERLSEVIRRAWENKKPCAFAGEFGRAVVGHCRRVVYDDKSAKMWGDTNQASFQSLEGGNDSGIELLYIFDEKQSLYGIVANIACPSQVVEHRSFLSSDYWGKVKKRLREQFGSGLYLLGLCSAAGDQCPRDMIRWIPPKTPIDDPNIKREKIAPRKGDPRSMFDIEGTEVLGRRIAMEIMDRYESALQSISEDETLVHRVLSLDLPVRRVTPAEYLSAENDLKAYVRHSGKDTFTFEDNAAMHVCAGTIARYHQQQQQDVQPVELHVIRLGKIVFATNPFELFLDYGNQIKARSAAEQTFLIQLSCGAYGYLPTEKAEQGGHYSAYVSSGITGHEGGDLLVRKTLQSIRSLFLSGQEQSCTGS